MGREEQIISERIRKLEELRKEGVNPYPNKYDKKQTCLECSESKIKGKVKTAGRLMTKRDLGKIAFCVLRDGTGKIQIVLQEKESPEKVREFFKKYTDVGDFVGIEGEIIKTKTGEISILAKKIDLISKSILPLPEKWKGIQDEEGRYRKRYLDILMNDEVKEMFIKKSKFWNTIRSFLLEKGFLEVETPVLETSAGGAAAKPFITHHNALDIDVYLRISMGELWQKKLMVAGYEKTFEIGRQFRNEGMDMEHLQDYTQMEFYWGYANYEDGMKLVEEMYKRVAKDVFGTMKFEIHGYKIDLSKKWEIYDFEKLIKKETGIDIYKADTKEIKKKLNELKVDYDDSVDKWRLIDQLWKYCRKNLSGPGFLTGQPVELTPLAKRNPEDKRKVQQFQVIIAGSELGNGYSELNDPLDQEQRFIEQAKQKEAGDSESMEHDKSFVEALKYGMPPTCGFGLSERLFAFLSNKTMRECVIFPLMRSEGEDKEKEEK
jgi:lysyl-tRNA synthetase class 2